MSFAHVLIDAVDAPLWIEKYPSTVLVYMSPRTYSFALWLTIWCLPLKGSPSMVDTVLLSVTYRLSIWICLAMIG